MQICSFTSEFFRPPLFVWRRHVGWLNFKNERYSIVFCWNKTLQKITDECSVSYKGDVQNIMGVMTEGRNGLHNYDFHNSGTNFLTIVTSYGITMAKGRYFYETMVVKLSFLYQIHQAVYFFVRWLSQGCTDAEHFVLWPKRPLMTVDWNCDVLYIFLGRQCKWCPQLPSSMFYLTNG